MKPSIGRLVHFVRGGRHWAAVVTQVWSDTCVNLFRFPDGSHDTSAESTPTPVTWDGAGLNDYTWHWPEREPERTDHELAVQAAREASL